MKPQVGDIIQVKEERLAEWKQPDKLFGPGPYPRGGLVIRLIEWPPDARSVVDCVVFQDPTLANPVQLQTRFVEVISRA